VVGRWLLERGLGLIAAGEVRAGCDVLAQVRQLAQVEGRGSVAELPAVPEAGSEADPLPGIEARLEKARRFRLRPKPGIPVRADLRKPTTRGEPKTGHRRGLPSTSVMAEYEVRRTLDDILYPPEQPTEQPTDPEPGQPDAIEPEPEPEGELGSPTPQGG